MSVTSFVEIWDARRSVETGNRSEGAISHFRSFLVTTNNALDDGAVVLASGDTIGTQHANDPNAYLEHREAINDPNHRLVWRVNLEYSSSRTRTTSPLTEPAVISWGFAQFSRPAIKDRDGSAIVNSAGDPFDPAPEIDDSRLFCRVTKNVPAVPEAILKNMMNKTNTDPIVVDGVAIGTNRAKVQALTVSPKRIRNGIIYRTLEYELHLNFATGGWTLSELDRGFREVDGTSGTRKAIVNDSDSSDPSQPVLLNGSGGVLSDPTAATAEYVDFEVYEETSFGPLPFV